MLALSPPPAAVAQTVAPLVVGAGDVDGISYIEAGALCRMLNRKANSPDPRCLVEPGYSATKALSALRAGRIGIAIVQAQAALDAAAGRPPFTKEGAFADLRLLATLVPEPLVVVASASSGVKTLADLKGKRVNLGRPGSYQRMMGENLLKAAAFTPPDLGGLLELDFPDQVKALCDNRLDVGIFSGLHPLNEVQEALDDCSASLIPVKDAAVERVLKTNPALVAAPLAEGLYQGPKGETQTFAMATLLVTTRSLADEQATRIAKLLQDRSGGLRGLHPVLERLPNGGDPFHALPLHEALVAKDAKDSPNKTDEKDGARKKDDPQPNKQTGKSAP